MNIICLGDSLMQKNTSETFPQAGWPEALEAHLADSEHNHVLDFALNGRSTKSFIDEGHFAEALSKTVT